MFVIYVVIYIVHCFCGEDALEANRWIIKIWFLDTNYFANAFDYSLL